MAATVTVRPGRLAWFEVYVGDLARARQFYGDVLGWTFEPLAGVPREGYLTILTSAGEPVNGALVQATDRQPAGDPGRLLYFEVADIPAAVETALARGGRLHQPYTDIGAEHGYCAVLQDPEGNHVALWADH